VPMYFVRRGGRYIDASGQSFRDFMAGSLPALPGEYPTLADWEDHLTTAFPEVRLKKFLEMRGADGGPWNRLCALPALWVGALYDQASLDGCLELCKGWTRQDLADLIGDVARNGLGARIQGRLVRDVARDMLALAHQGLSRRKRVSASGEDETGFLGPLHEIVETGMTPAEVLLERYRTEWDGKLEPLFIEQAYY